MVQRLSLSTWQNLESPRKHTFSVSLRSLIKVGELTLDDCTWVIYAISWVSTLNTEKREDNIGTLSQNKPFLLKVIRDNKNNNNKASSSASKLTALNCFLGAHKTVQQGKVLVTKPGDQSSIPNTYMAEGEH